MCPSYVHGRERAYMSERSCGGGEQHVHIFVSPHAMCAGSDVEVLINIGIPILL
jgi:hypothetical protein